MAFEPCPKIYIATARRCTIFPDVECTQVAQKDTCDEDQYNTDDKMCF